MAKGIVQLCQFEDRLDNEAIRNLKLSDKPILLLVMLDDWIFTGPDIRDVVFGSALKLAGEKGVSSERIESREIVLCTAAELDQILSTYSYEIFKRICEKSLEEKYKRYALSGLIQECFQKEKQPIQYPLEAELDDLIGLPE